MLTTRQRIGLLGPVLKEFPELGPLSQRELADWMRLEFGSVDALDRWIPYGQNRTRARAPRSIYHLCPGNIVVAGLQSLLAGLLLGARNIVKLPRDPQISAALREFVKKLPLPLRRTVMFRAAFDAADLRSAEAVIAFGRDETIAEIRRHLLPHQVLVAYGHKVSFLWLGKVTGRDEDLLRSCAWDILLYGQLGCLSPQAIYLAPGSDLEGFCAGLAAALEYDQGPLRISLEAASSIRQARQLAKASGARIWESAHPLLWTIIADKNPRFVESCGHRVIYVRTASRTQLKKVLAPLRGAISTVGLREPFAKADVELFWDLQAQRLCPVGRCQDTPFSWHHDGRPQLSDLVKWVDREG